MTMLSESKNNLRNQIRGKLKILSNDDNARKSSLVSKNLKNLIESFDLQDFFIGGYAPMNYEVNWYSCLSCWSTRFCFPKPQAKNSMIFAKSQPEDLVDSTEFGPKIKVPSTDKEEVEPTLLIMPGIAFTKDGQRLGQGGGYYDRYLQNFKGIKIGICFEEQVVTQIPLESHDFSVDYVVCESGYHQQNVSCA